MDGRGGGEGTGKGREAGGVYIWKLNNKIWLLCVIVNYRNRFALLSVVKMKWKLDVGAERWRADVI
jgi:hypothetical protein